MTLLSTLRRSALPGIALLFTVQGCALIAPPSTIPMAAIRVDRLEPGVDALIVMLPGMGDRAERFIETGFVDAANGSGYELLAADAHWGYYFDRTMTQRLHEDIITPARADGYERIWLLGISMGGLGSLLYASEFPSNIDGLILLAPFLGDACLAEEIADAGGLRAWSGESRCTTDYEVGAWRWLKEVTAAGSVEIVLGYGVDDRLAPSYSPLLDVLPASRVHTLDGGHNWTTWNALWARIGAAGQTP